MKCCVCKKFKGLDGVYYNFIPVCPKLEISYGCCIDCVKLYYPEIAADVLKQIETYS